MNTRGNLKHLFVIFSFIFILFSSSTLAAAIKLNAGDWDIEFSGNVGGFLTNMDCDPNDNGTVNGGLACGSNGLKRDRSNIQTGLLPSWLGFHAETSKHEYKTGITIGFQPGIDSNTDISGAPLDGGLGLNSSNFRQVFLEFGQDSWGSIKIGRDLGLFGSDALLSDMSLLGVGTISDLVQGGGNTTLGRIGVGYLYADWKAQIQYASPKRSGFSFNLAVVDPWGLVDLSGGDSHNADSFNQKGDTFGLEGKAGYEFGGTGSGPKGKLWAGFINQSIDSESLDNASASGFDIGAKVAFGTNQRFEVVGYYYAGEGIGTTDFLFDAVALNGQERDSDGFYVQGTFKIPGPETKLGLSFGESNLDLAAAEASSNLVETNESIIAGIYHPLTPDLTLTLEYTNTEATAHSGNSAEESTIALGGIMFF